jgi:hypothetical protein
MTDHARIIERYRQAETEERLNLFLECPELRNDFIKIDLGEYRSESPSIKKNAMAPVKSYIRRWRNAMAHCRLIFRKA